LILDTQDRISYSPSPNKGLLVQFADIYHTAEQISRLEPLLAKSDRQKVKMLKALFPKMSTYLKS